MARIDREQSPDMTEGAEITRRRERLGMSKVALAQEAGVTRETLGAVESGQGFRRDTLTKITRALDALEEEAGVDAPGTTEGAPDLIEFRVEGLYGAKAVIVKGPVKDKEALLDVVERLMRGQSDADDA